ncbi:hypothetical protein LIER_41847 [Lithospermum erythrorhizon]|uniref:DUF4283 domain-containing protein n=1 Tax=Lithospermum erythrorhizon TaxID=34254 RepID=A0AAV3RIZ7_LITER
MDTNLELDPFSLRPTSLYQGKPLVVLPLADKHTLRGDYNVSLFDNKHIFIECSSKVDFYRIWLKLIWFVKGFSMRVFKWVPEFSPLLESAIAPVWVRLEGLPLLTISNAVGKPIRVDPRNVNHSMLNSARICVELDVSKTLTDAIWVCFEDETSKNLLDGFWVKVFYDVVPKFCTFCSHIGHGMDVCKRRLDVSLKVVVQARGKTVGKDLPRQNVNMVKSADQVFVSLPQPVLHGKKVQHTQLNRDMALQIDTFVSADLCLDAPISKLSKSISGDRVVLDKAKQVQIEVELQVTKTSSVRLT